MKLDTHVAKSILRKDMVIPIKTLKASKKDEYAFMRISDGYYLCQHGDKAYIVYMDDVRSGCSCPAMTYHCNGNDVCKHIAALVGLKELPQKSIPDAIGMELIGAGWTGVMGALQPPDNPVQATHDEDGEGNDGGDSVPSDADKPETKTDTPEPPGSSEQKHEEKNMEPNEHVKRLIAEAEGYGAKDVDPEYVSGQIKALKRFKVSAIEADRSVVSAILRTYGGARPKNASGASNQLVTVDQIAAEGMWINLRVKVTKLWDSAHESMRQSGVIGDETGTTKFVSWEKANLALLELDKCYSIENVVTNEYEGTYSVAFTKNTKFTALEEDIEVGYSTAEFTGVMVDIRDSSGLIKRCPICNRATKSGICEEHEAVDGIPDLRIIGVIDNGIVPRSILLNKEQTEALTGITIDAATAMAIEAFDASVVADKMRDMIVGREFSISGSDMGDMILVENIIAIDAPVSKESIESLLKEV